MRRKLAAALLGLMTLLPHFAIAADATYRVDLIVFVDLWHSGDEAGIAPGSPNLSNAIRLEDVAALRAAGIEVLPDEQFGLDAEWKNLRYSKQFKPLVRLAWTQRNPPTDRGPAIRIQVGGAAGGGDTSAAAVDSAGSGPQVQGSVALLLSRYLHLDVDLQYVEDGSAWALDERRRMRRDEIHHLDSPRLGVLAKVGKASGADNDAAPPPQ